MLCVDVTTFAAMKQQLLSGNLSMILGARYQCREMRFPNPHRCWKEEPEAFPRIQHEPQDVNLSHGRRDCASACLRKLKCHGCQLLVNFSLPLTSDIDRVANPKTRGPRLIGTPCLLWMVSHMATPMEQTLSNRQMAACRLAVYRPRLPRHLRYPRMCRTRSSTR